MAFSSNTEIHNDINTSIINPTNGQLTFIQTDDRSHQLVGRQWIRCVQVLPPPHQPPVDDEYHQRNNLYARTKAHISRGGKRNPIIRLITSLLLEHFLLVAEFFDVVNQTPATLLSAGGLPQQTGRVDQIAKHNGCRDVTEQAEYHKLHSEGERAFFLRNRSAWNNGKLFRSQDVVAGLSSNNYLKTIINRGICVEATTNVMKNNSIRNG